MPTQTTAAARERYLTLIEATLRKALADRLAKSLPGGLTMELALPAIACHLGMIRSDGDAFVEVVDRIVAAPVDACVSDGAGQTRSTYRPLLMRCVERLLPHRADRHAFGRVDERMIQRLETFGRAPGAVLTSDGADVAAHAFDAMLIGSQNGRVRVSLRAQLACNAVFDRLLAMQRADGRFLTSTADDQLEPAWYHEVAVLHATTLYATFLERSPLRLPRTTLARSAAARSARYHAEQVQPDHASSHPFGLAALLDDAEGIHLADMMLHAAGVQQPATMDATSLVLLFDALDCGRRVEPA